MSCSVRLRLLVPLAASLALVACGGDDDEESSGPTHGGPATCLTLEAECSQFGHCAYEDGAPKCFCDPGFRGDGYDCVEIAQCDQDRYCSPHAICLEVERAADVCVCPDGYTEGAAPADPAYEVGPNCVDVDECFDHPCDEHATCTNTIGSYVCACDPTKGYTEDDDPYTAPGTTCVDLDECAADVDECDPHAYCTNTEGGYTCACNGDLGYAEDLDPETKPGTVCVDLDECAEDLDDCDAHAVCTNVAGGFTCACGTGYVEDDDPNTRPGTVCLAAP